MQVKFKQINKLRFYTLSIYLKELFEVPSLEATFS
jgi:hypothetical protein